MTTIKSSFCNLRLVFPSAAGGGGESASSGHLHLPEGPRLKKIWSKTLEKLA